jgi:hypothetical protein
LLLRCKSADVCDAEAIRKPLENAKGPGLNSDFLDRWPDFRRWADRLSPPAALWGWRIRPRIGLSFYSLGEAIMKAGFLILGLLLAGHCFAAVKFVGDNWRYGGSENKVIQKVGISTSETGVNQVAINFANMEQLIFTDRHVPVGLSLVPYQGRCVRIVPGKNLASVNLVLTCED